MQPKIDSVALAAAVLAAGVGLSNPAAAHVVLEERAAPAASYHTATLIVPHGCDGKPTLSVRVHLPEGLTSVKPQPKPGWRLSIERGPRPEPVTGGHGHTHTEGVREIVWDNGNLPDDQFDTFAVMMRLPDAPAGTALRFPVIQTCAGDERHWVETRAEGEAMPKSPVPTLRLRAPE